MANPFRTITNTYNKMPDMSGIRQAYQVLKTKGNPMLLMQNMAKTNPQLKPVMQALSNGANPQQVFTNLCHQMGIDPDEFIRNMIG